MRILAAALTVALVGFATPAAAQPASECRHIPPVHHRMHGHSGPTREGDGLENTLTGMQLTYDAGGRWFETDAQEVETRGGVHGGGPIVLFHDFTLDRTTGQPGILRNRSYAQLPATTEGQRIPKLGEAFAWLADHPKTHLLIEVKMTLQWDRVTRLLTRYGFAGTRRVLFDIGGGGSSERKHQVALDMHHELGPYAVTGLKRWNSINRPNARYLRNFGTSVRLDLQQGITHKRDLTAVGVDTRFSKIINTTPTQPAAPLWREAVESGAFTGIITEETPAYLAWCARQQETR